MDEAQVANVQVTPEVAAPEVVSDKAPVVASDTPQAENDAPKTLEPVQEKMIPQSQVNKIAAREARQAAERARNETLAEFQRQQAAHTQNTPPAQQMSDVSQFTPEQLEQKIYEAAHRMSTQMTADKITKDFEAKIAAEIEADPDFGDTYDSLNMAQHPELVIWMNGMDNSAKVVKDLANNPSKFANILMLAKSGLPGLAQKELNKLHDSIKTNLAAQAQPKAKEPLNQLSPTNIGTSNGENSSVSDFMKMDWLRG